MPRTAKKITKKPAKKVAKKAIKKAVTKRKYTRHTPVTLDDVVTAARTAGATVEVDMVADSVNQACEGTSAALRGDAGQFSASGLLNLEMVNTIRQARGNVTIAVRKLIDASITCEKNAHLTQSERDVLLAKHRVSVAEFELAMDGLEAAVRGS